MTFFKPGTRIALCVARAAIVFCAATVDTEFVKVQSASKDKKPYLSAAVLVVEL